MTMSIVFAGTPANAAATLRELHSAGVEVALVITRPDAEVGRKRVLTPSAVASAASELKIPVIKATKIGERELEAIHASGSKLGIVVAYGALLRTPALAALELGWYNLHYSLLPRWRGAAPVQHAILNRDDVTGVTLFKLDEGLDTGPIAGQVAVPIEVSDNTESLLQRLTGLGTSLLLQEIPKILAGVGRLAEQSELGVTLAPKPTRRDARVFDTDSAVEALAKIRAYEPEPGAWLAWSGAPFKIINADLSRVEGLEAFSVASAEGAVLMGTSTEALRLIEVQPAGKGRMSAADWFRGTTPETRVFE